MPRRVFFSFHYQDIWRVSQVRQSGVVKGKTSSSRPIDHASWEEIRRKGEGAITAWIDRQMNGAGVTVLLIGTETYSRKYCLYEIDKAISEGKGLVAVHINKIRDQQRRTKHVGRNPLRQFSCNVKESFFLWEENIQKNAFNIYKTYDWIDDNGYLNFNDWVEEAASAAGR